jgi:ribosome-associated protein
MVRINDTLEIPDTELGFRYSRSSGPGGQNVNKVATKVTLLFAVADSAALGEHQRALVAERLANRIAKDGVLHLSSERHRTRSANQRDAVERFATLVAAALAPRKRRRARRSRPSAPPSSSSDAAAKAALTPPTDD